MINLRKEIVKLLKRHLPNVAVDGKVKSRVHYQKSDKDTPFPYIVYDFPNSFMDEEQEVFNLDVDVWDNQDDTTVLETIASDIWRSFSRYRYIDRNIQFSIYRENRLPPLDEDEKNIKRRKLIFQLRYFDRRD